jgi:hypothetical protein
MSAAERAPMGKPQSAPSKNTQAPASLTPNRFFMGFESGDETVKPTPLATKSSDITAKGKREGTTTRAHSESPFFIYSIATSDDISTVANATSATVPVSARFFFFILSIGLIKESLCEDRATAIFIVISILAYSVIYICFEVRL